MSNAAGRKGDLSIHGDRHPVAAVTGSANVLINGRPALRVGDRGSDSSWSHTWKAVRGASHVLINGKKAHRRGDAAMHGPVSGTLIAGSLHVLIGDYDGSGEPHSKVALHWFGIHLAHADGKPVEGAEITVLAPDGQNLHEASNGDVGHMVDRILPRGKVKVSIKVERSRKGPK